MSSELDDLIRNQEKKFSQRARERQAEGDAIIFLDARPQISSAAFDRDNARAWKFCKMVFWCLVVSAIGYGVIWALFAAL